MSTLTKILTPIGIFFVIGLLFWFLIIDHPKDESDITNFPPDGRTIVAFGDSLVYGTGDPKGGGFALDLSESLDVPIINAGVPGDTTRDGLARMKSIIAYKPNIVLLLFGGNDALKNIPKSETKKNLAAMITKLQNSGAVLILLGVQGGLFGDPYDEMYEDLAKKYGTLYVSNVLEGIIGHRDLMANRVHPNEAGYEIIAKRIKPKLKRLLKTTQ